jgi:nicotinamidase-related amidase
MPIELKELVDPSTTALLANELKRVTVGDLQKSSPSGAPGNPLGAIAEELGTGEKLGRLARAARAAGVRVVHCHSAFRADGAGSMTNAPILASGYKTRQRLLLGSPEAEPIHELGPEDEDLISTRLHGVAPFVGTELDSMLRSLGIKTVVLIGGSVNIGIPGACMEAVDFGYKVVIPRDGVIGVPEEFVNLAFQHQLGYLARITTVDELIDVWGAA